MPSLQKAVVTADKVNHFMARLMPITTPMSIVMGFLLSSVFINLRPAVQFLFGLMTFSGALKLRAGELGKTVRNPVPILLFFAAAHVVMPVIAMLVSSLFIDNPDVVAGFVLLFSSPTAVSGFIWITILKGDMALGLTLILFDTILAPLVVPGSISILMGAKVAMDMTGIGVSLLLMIVVPTIIGVGVNEASKGKVPAAVTPFLDPIAKLCLMTVVATNASIIAPNVRLDDPLIWKTAVFVVILTFTGFFVVKLVAVIGKCRAPKDIAMIICGGLRNNSAVMTVAVAFFPEAAVFPTLISIMTQQSIAAIMGKLFAKNKKGEDQGTTG